MSLLFVCTGNFYRSRFAELYFRHLAAMHDVDCPVDSRGLQLEPTNEGPLSCHTIRECERLGISTEPLRLPLELLEKDLDAAELTIAVKETEHRPLLRKKFPHWADRIEYWEVHDLDLALPDEAFRQLRHHVDCVFARVRSRMSTG